MLDLSHPSGQRDNDGIEPGLSSQHYVSVDNVVSFSFGQEVVLAKVYMKHECSHPPGGQGWKTSF